jgi:hypothetical protein
MAVENRGPQVEGVAILFLTLSWVFVALRCYVRAVLMKGFGMDDWLAIAALVSAFPYPQNSETQAIFARLWY